MMVINFQPRQDGTWAAWDSCIRAPGKPWSVHIHALGVRHKNQIHHLLSFCAWKLCFKIHSKEWKYLSTKATMKLVTSLILSHLDYCSSLLSGLPASSVHSLHHIHNCAACLVPQKCKTDCITPLFQFLHWLPIQQRIQYKINTLCYKCTYHEHCSVLALWLSI